MFVDEWIIEGGLDTGGTVRHLAWEGRDVEREWRIN